jgi:hypothetical protein
MRKKRTTNVFIYRNAFFYRNDPQKEGEMGNRKPFGPWLMTIVATLMLMLGCSSGGSGSDDNGDPPRDLGTMTVVVETNQEDAAFVITDAEGTSHSGGGKTFSDSLPAGSASIAFHSIDNFCTPGLQTLTGSKGDTVRFTANYNLGCSANLIINTNMDDAKFMLFGPENIYSGLGKEWEVYGIPTGQYTIRFDALDDPCDLPPAMQTITIVAGSTEERTLNYTQDDACSDESFLFKDEDHDGYSDGTKLPADSVEDASAYELPSSLISTAGDCDDEDPFENPGTSGQFCTTTTWYLDADGDGYANSEAQLADNRPGVDYYLAAELISSFGDCDDDDAAINPGVSEVCHDEIDNNCDNLTDCAEPACDCPTTCTDGDGDSFFATTGCGTALDCDDEDTAINPGATDVADDGIDQNCTGADLRTWYLDSDGDGYGDSTETRTSETQPEDHVGNSNDCDDSNANISPGDPEVCDDNIDNDCDGDTDTEDSDCDNPSTTTVFSEDFEAGWNDWFADNGNWEVGTPTSGPSVAHSGSNVGGTVLAGDYANTTSSLVSPTIELPTIETGEEIHLRFWNWFSFGSQDRGDVRVSQQTAPGVWTDWVILGTHSGASGVWTHAMVDLSAYAGMTVRIGFQLRQGSYSYVGPGWFVDDVLIKTTSKVLVNTRYTFNFENGLQDWSAHNGGWEVGAPTSGPDTAYSGTSVGGTVLAGDYPNTTSTLVSPTFQLPAISAGEEVHLRFWQWFSFGSQDRGDIIVQQQSAPGVWSDWAILTTYNGASAVWTNTMVDLSEYADSNVRIGFQLRQGSYSYVGPGWYVDDVLVEIN